MRQSFLALAVSVVLAWSGAAHGLTIQFDYTYDTSNFFTNSERVEALEAAGDFYERILTDTLSSIVPSGGNTWTPNIIHPATGNNQSIPALSVPANTVIVYVGSRDFDPGTLAQGGPGGYTASGTSFWRVNTIERRGEGAPTQGSTATEFAPWGGSISFDSNSPWNFDYQNGPFSGQSDFWSVALHELGHVFGIGTADSWDNLIDGQTFEGSKSMAEYGGPVPTQSSGSHWADGTDSVVYQTPISQDAAMDPTILRGKRKRFTALDVTGLDDIGWDIAAPELLGDFNNDGIVSTEDFTIWRDTIGSTLDLRADADWDGLVDNDDYTFWKANFGLVAGAGSGTASALVLDNSLADPSTVPEPASVYLLCIALAALAVRHAAWSTRDRS